MSLNVLHAPKQIATTGEPIYYKVQATNPDIAGVTIVVIKKGDSAYGVITSWQQKPDIGTTDIYTIQFDEVLQDHISFDVVDLDQDLVSDRPNSLVDYKVLVQSVDGQGDQVGIIVLDDAKETYIINGATSELDVVDIEPYLLENKDRYFLTNSPNEKWIGRSEYEYLDTIALESEQHDLLIHFKQRDGSLRFNYGPVFRTEAQKAHRIQVGTNMVNSVLPGYIDNDTLAYDIYLRSMIGDNLFVEGDRGTFETSVSGIHSPTGFALTRVNTESRTGNYSMSATPQQGTANTFSDLWTTNAEYTLQSGKTYRFTVRFTYHVNTISQDSITIRPYATGFSDAVIAADQYDLSAYSYANGYYFTKSMWLTVGSDTKGQFCFQFNNDLPGVTLYFDDIELYEEVTSSKLKTYRIDHECHTDPTRVHFMNKLGGLDSFTFTGTEKQNLAVSGEVYERRRPLDRKYNDRGIIDLQKKAKRTLKCSSGPLIPEEMLWLEELLVSPAVYVERDAKLLPVVVKSGEFELLNRQKNIHSMSVQLQFANAGISQRN